MHNAAKTYFQTQFATMGQGEVLILLYDGALKFLARAREQIASNDYGGKGISISKALDIIAELDGTLNPELGGELAENLHQLYFICSMRLLKANLKMDVELIDSVMEVLSGLRSAYAEIVNSPEAQAASQQITAKQKHFNVKGRADLPSEVSTSPLAGGARASMAYAAAAIQTDPAQQPGAMPPAQPSQPIRPPAPTTQANTMAANRSASAAYGRAASQYRP